MRRSMISAHIRRGRCGFLCRAALRRVCCCRSCALLPNASPMCGWILPPRMALSISSAPVLMGESVARDMVALRITPPVQAVIVAAPDYLARCPAPQSPQDLAGQRCIGFRQLGGGRLYRWEFVRDGQAFEQAVSSALVLDDPELMLDAAMRGLGLAYALDVFCRAALTDGRLLPVLEGWLPRYDGFFLYYPNRQVSAALRALCEVLREG